MPIHTANRLSSGMHAAASDAGGGGHEPQERIPVLQLLRHREVDDQPEEEERNQDGDKLVHSLTSLSIVCLYVCMLRMPAYALSGLRAAATRRSFCG